MTSHSPRALQTAVTSRPMSDALLYRRPMSGALLKWAAVHASDVSTGGLWRVIRVLRPLNASHNRVVIEALTYRHTHAYWRTCRTVRWLVAWSSCMGSGSSERRLYRVKSKASNTLLEFVIGVTDTFIDQMSILRKSTWRIQRVG